MHKSTAFKLNLSLCRYLSVLLSVFYLARAERLHKFSSFFFLLFVLWHMPWLFQHYFECKMCSSGDHCRKLFQDYCKAKPTKAAESLLFTQYFHKKRGIYSKCTKSSYDKSPTWYCIWYFDLRKCHHAAVSCVVTSLNLAWLEAAVLCFGPAFGFVVDATWQLWCWMICNADPVCFSLPHKHKHTQTHKWCLLLSHMAKSTMHAVPPKLPTIYWALPLVYVSAMIRNSFRRQEKKGEKKRGCVRKKGTVSEIKWGHAQSLWHLSALTDNQLSFYALLWYILSVIFRSF